MTMLAMCGKRDCPSYDSCYRAQAEADQHQAYNDFDNNGESCCDYYIPIKPEWKQKYISID